MTSKERWRLAGICIFLAGIVWFVFFQTLQHDFINFDDPDYILKNRHVNAGLTSAGIGWAFTSVYAANWHPLTWLSHMLDCQFYGLNPWGHHLSSVLLHGLNAVLLFLVLRRMTGALWPSAFVATVFAVHPLRVESVAWIAERKDVLSALFFILTVGAYARYTRRSSAARYGLVLFLFALGLMCKPMLVTVPLILLLLDYWPLQRLADKARKRAVPTKRLLLEKLPFFALSGGLGIMTILAQKDALRPLAHFPLSTKLGNALLSTVTYIRQMFWPSDLVAYYPLSAASIVPAKVIGAVVLLLVISGLVFYLRGHRYLVTGWLWYLIMLVPVIGILQVGNQAHADRYTYLPQIGLYLMVAWGGSELIKRWQLRPLVAAVPAFLILIPLALLARAEAAHWRESETLWRHALARTSHNAMAELNLGEALYRKNALDEAVSHFRRAAEIQPDVATIHGSLGVALFSQGQLQEAMDHMRRSLELDPKQAGIHSSFGVALLEAGKVDESLAHLKKALEIDPNEADAHYNLGNTLLRKGAAAEAVAEYERALQLNPNDIQALNNAGWILSTWPDASVRNGSKAVAMAEKAYLLTQGSDPVIGATLAAAYAETGRFGEAIATAREALQSALRQGDRARADYLRGQITLFELGQPFREQR